MRLYHRLRLEQAKGKPRSRCHGRHIVRSPKRTPEAVTMDRFEAQTTRETTVAIVRRSKEARQTGHHPETCVAADAKTHTVYLRRSQTWAVQTTDTSHDTRRLPRMIVDAETSMKHQATTGAQPAERLADRRTDAFEDATSEPTRRCRALTHEAGVVIHRATAHGAQRRADDPDDLSSAAAIQVMRAIVATISVTYVKGLPSANAIPVTRATDPLGAAAIRETRTDAVASPVACMNDTMSIAADGAVHPNVAASRAIVAIAVAIGVVRMTHAETRETETATTMIISRPCIWLTPQTARKALKQRAQASLGVNATEGKAKGRLRGRPRRSPLVHRRRAIPAAVPKVMRRPEPTTSLEFVSSVRAIRAAKRTPIPVVASLTLNLSGSTASVSGQATSTPREAEESAVAVLTRPTQKHRPNEIARGQPEAVSSSDAATD
ncbi:unnamed protein product [Trichogramma brassicae]|uniref:Uncharacterized protein n=1 Tax=Trichogramma brassicae TaxID=86971 RepID=A0A6H5I0X7_9HYME|nr:unnamed protein product [Trichogramma brassicae]